MFNKFVPESSVRFLHIIFSYDSAIQVNKSVVKMLASGNLNYSGILEILHSLFDAEESYHVVALRNTNEI